MNDNSNLNFTIKADSKELVNGVNEGLYSLNDMGESGKKANDNISVSADKANTKIKKMAKSASDALAIFTGYAVSIGGAVKAIRELAVYMLFQKQVDELEALSDIAKHSAENIKSMSSANESYRRSTDDCMKRLGELAKQEMLSNSEKVEQRKLLKELAGGYDDLVKIMVTSEGKIKDFDKAMAMKLKRDHDRLLAETEAEMNQIKVQMDAQREITRKGNFFMNMLTFGQSDKKKLEAAEKLNALTDQYMKLKQKQFDMERENPAADYMREAAAAKKDKAEADAAQKRQAALDKAAEGLKNLDEARGKYAEAEKRRAKALADEQIRQDKKSLDSRLSNLKKQADAQRKRLAGFGFALDVNPDETASDRHRRVARSRLDESIAEKQRIQMSGGSVRYTVKEKERIAEYRNAKGRLAKTEEQIAQLEAAGKAAEAARQEQAAAERLQESASALSQAAMELKAAGGVVPSQPMPQATPSGGGGKAPSPASPVPGRRVNVAASGFSQVTNYTPMLSRIIGLLQTRAFIVRG